MTDVILARAFACANDTEQAEMLNSMSREMFVRCRGNYGFEMQCCTLSGKLNADGIALVKQLAAFIDLREKDIKS